MKPSFKLFVFFLLIIGAAYSVRAFKVEHTDYMAYYMAGKRLWAKTTGADFKPGIFFTKQETFHAGDSLYQALDDRPYKYPPTFAYIFIPFSFAPYFTGQFFWYAFCYLFLILSFYLIYIHFKEDYFKDPKITFIFFALLFLVQFRFTINDFKSYQVNFHILACTLGLLHYWKTRQNIAAIFLALLVGIKVFPIFLLVFLFVEKEYRLIGKTLLAGLVLIIIPFLSYKSVGNIVLEYQNYFNMMTNSNVHDFPAPSHYKHPSLDSFFVRLLMDRTYHKEFKANILALSPQTTFYIILTFKAFFFGLLIWAQKSLKKLIKDPRDLKLYYFAIISLYSNFFAIINPLAWKHGLVILFLSWTLLGILYLQKIQMGLKEKGFFIFSVLFLILSNNFMWGETSREIIGAVGVDFLGVLCISVLLFLYFKKYLIFRKHSFLPTQNQF